MMSEQARKSMGAGLALLVALPEEARGILKVGDWQRVPSSASLATYRGRVGGAEAILAVSGVGKARAEATAREVIAEHHPDAVVSLGFAGGLTEVLAAGDLVVAETLMSVVIPQNGPLMVSEPLASNAQLVGVALDTLAEQGLNHQTGSCLTTSHIASNPEEKATLGKTTGALAVEMESYWIGQVCREHNVAFIAVRAIVDSAGHRLPNYASKFAFDAGNKSRWRQTLPALLRPWWIPGLVQLGAASAKAQKGLTAFAVAFLESYAQEPVAPTTSPTVEPG